MGNASIRCYFPGPGDEEKFGCAVCKHGKLNPKLPFEIQLLLCPVKDRNIGKTGLPFAGKQALPANRVIKKAVLWFFIKNHYIRLILYLTNRRRAVIFVIAKKGRLYRKLLSSRLHAAGAVWFKAKPVFAFVDLRADRKSVNPYLL